MSNRWVSYNSIRSDLNELSDFYYPTQDPQLDIRLVGNEPPPPTPPEEYHEMESEDEEEEVFCGERYRKGPHLDLIGDMLRLVEHQETSTEASKRFVSKPPGPSPRHVYIDIQKPTNTPKKQAKNIIPVSIERNSQVDKPQDRTSLTSMIPSFGFRKAIASIQQHDVVNENEKCNLNNSPSAAQVHCPTVENGLRANVAEFIPRSKPNGKAHLTPEAVEFVPRHLLPNSAMPCNIISSESTHSKKTLDNHQRLHSRNVSSVPDKKIVKRKIVKDKPEDLVDVFNICNSELPYSNKPINNSLNKPVINNNSIKQNANNEAIESILRMSRVAKPNENNAMPSSCHDGVSAVKLLTPNDFKISTVENKKTSTKSFNLMDEIRKLGLESQQSETPIDTLNKEKDRIEKTNTMATSKKTKINIESCIPTVDTLQKSCLPAFTGHDKVNEWLNGPRPEITRPKDYPRELLKPFGFRKIATSNNESPPSSTTFSKDLEKMSSSSCRSTPVPEYQPRASYYEIHAKLLKSAEEKEKSQVKNMNWWEKAEHLMKKREEEQRNVNRASKTK